MIDYSYSATAKVSDVAEDAEFKVIYVGARSQRKNTFTVKGNMRVSEFKQLVFINNHEEYDEDEKSYTETHAVRTKGGKCLGDSKTFNDYGITGNGPPHELSIYPGGLKGGAKLNIKKKTCTIQKP